jgi:hypothetical protein
MPLPRFNNSIQEQVSCFGKRAIARQLEGPGIIRFSARIEDRFVGLGPVIVYAWIRACGRVNDQMFNGFRLNVRVGMKRVQNCESEFDR